MTDQIDTGFESLVAPAVPVEVQADAQATPGPMSADRVQRVHPAGLSKEEAAARTAAEIAEGKRQAALHANDPVVPHPSQLSDPDAAPKILAELAARQEESEAARMNREFFEKIQAARNQPPPPPPQPQPTPPAVSEQTRKEMAEGARIAARHAEQQASVVRRPLNAREIAAQGTTTPVFTPDVESIRQDRPFGVPQGYRTIG